MAKGKTTYFLRDAHDRNFTEDTDGVALNLKAGVKTEVEKKAALSLKEKYPYLELTTE